MSHDDERAEPAAPGGSPPATHHRRRLMPPSFVGYRSRWLRADLVAGLTVWAVLVPESLAYATIAGVPPVVGLYAAVPALAVYALVGSSRHLIVAPMSATAALSLGIVADVAGTDGDVVVLTAALAVATGLVAMAAGLLRLGFLASFISEPVLKGFIIGLALTIMIGQLPALVGVEKGSGNFFEQTWDLLTHLNDAQALATVVGLGSLTALLVLRRWLPFVPGSLAVALLGIVVVALFGLDDHGLEIVGTIEPGLPDLGLPDVSGSDFLDLLAASVGVMLVGFAEGLGAAKTYAARAGYDIDPNRELFGLGAANLGAGLTSGMVVNGSLSKTAVNGAAGARSQISGLTAAALTVVTLLLLTGLFEKLPEATLAAIVVAAVIELVDIASLRRLWRVRSGQLASLYRLTSRADFLAAAATLLGVLLFETLPGLVIGVAISLALLIARTSRPHTAVLVPVPQAGRCAPGRAGQDLGRLRTQPRPLRRSRNPRGQGRGTVALHQRRRRSRGGPHVGDDCHPAAGAGRPRRADHSVDRRDRGRDARPASPGPPPPGNRSGDGGQRRAGARHPRGRRTPGRAAHLRHHR